MKKYLITLLSVSVLMVSGTQINAQSWNHPGNSNATASSKLGTTTNIPLRLFTNNVEQLHINANVTGKVGFVGIGTAAPNTRLHVNGVITATGGTSTNWNFASRIAGSFTTGRIPRWSGTAFVNGSVFDNGTSVGIGTTTPAYKLDVIGGSINTDQVYRIKGGTALYSDLNSNTFVGLGSGNPNSSGGYNVSLGSFALYYNTSGIDNTALGAWALLNSTTGTHNSAVGMTALYNNLSGNFNVAFGHNSNYYNTSGSYNTILGASAGCNQGTVPSNFTAIGHNAGHIGSNSGTIEIGNSFVTWIGGGTNWSNWSDRRIKDNITSNVPGLSFITKLNPVTYKMNMHRLNELCGITDTSEWEGKYNVEKITQTGFIAQEVEQAAKACNYDFSGVQAPWGNGKLYSLQYAAFVVPLVKAVQELNKANEELKLKNQELEKKITDIAAVMSDEQTRKLNNLNHTGGKAYLNQNIPNPFNKSTLIKYHIPLNFNHAVIKIYSINGVEIKSYLLTQSGSGEILLEANTMQAGIYSYTLIVDNEATDVKQMIITK